MSDEAVATVSTSTPNPIWEEIKKDAGIVLNVFLAFAPMVMSIVAPKSKATPFVVAIAPQIAPAMAAAQTMFNGTGDGQVREDAALALLSTAVSTGKVLSSGGQAHTLTDLEANMDTIKKIFKGVISSAKAVTAAATPEEKTAIIMAEAGQVAADGTAVVAALDKKDAPVINSIGAQVQAIAAEFSLLTRTTQLSTAA